MEERIICKNYTEYNMRIEKRKKRSAIETEWC